MRFPSHLLHFLVPPMLQNFLHGDLSIVLMKAVLQSSWNILWSKATVICTGGGGDPIYLIDLFADCPTLFQTVGAVDCDCDE